MPFIKLAREDNARRTFISEAQREEIFTAAAQEGLDGRVLVELAYLLAWRKGELLGLRVGIINIVDRTIRIDDSKNGDPREVPMTERLAMLMQQLVSGRPAEQKVFTKLGNFEVHWKRIKANAGHAAAKFHDWRRTSARTKRAPGTSVDHHEPARMAHGRDVPQVLYS